MLSNLWFIQLPGVQVSSLWPDPPLGELAVVVCSASTYEFVQGAADGLGIGREYGESTSSKDAYNTFLSKKKAEQDDLQKPPCDLDKDPFVDYDPFGIVGGIYRIVDVQNNSISRKALAMLYY